MKHETNQPPRGLPEHLPEGERILWQGAPSWKGFAMRVFHLRGLAIYFAMLLAWCIVSWSLSGTPAASVAKSALHLAGLAAVPIFLLALYGWGISRSTTYTITSRRVIIASGLVVPVTMNVPFTSIETAGLRIYAGGTGDIPLTLVPAEKLGYLLLWPHARPWRMGRAEPMLRGIADAKGVASLLARGLAANAAAGAAMAASNPRDAAKILPEWAAAA